MCSSANPTEEALQQSQAAFTNTLQSSFSTAFAANQAILGTLSASLKAAIANPQGFSPAALAAARTNSTDTVAQQTQAAQVAANSYLSAHGGADLGSGVGAQITGQVQGQGMQEQSTTQNAITLANEQQRQQNYWNAISGLTQVGQAYNPTGYAAAETGSANATTNASNAVSAEQQQSWNNAFGIVKGVAGLGMAATSLPSFGGGSGSAPSPGGFGDPNNFGGNVATL